jgi:hypothetical protein
MRKSLYMTTALAAAGMLAFGATDVSAAAKPIKLSLGGFLVTYVGWADQDGSFESTASATNRVGYDSFNIVNDTEVYFNGGTKLDNGVGVNVIIQMEGDPSGGAGTIDESYVKFTGGFGDLRMGTTKHASFVLRHGAPGVGMIGLGNPDTNNWIIRPGASSIGAGQSTHIGGGDQQKIVYITPKMNGFRVGAGYTPSTTASNVMPAVGGNAGTQTQIYDISFSYENKLGDMDLKTDINAWREQSTAAASIDAKRFGVSMGFGAVTIAGSYLDEGAVDSGQIGAGNPNLEAMDVGVAYKMSAATSVSGSFMNVKKENATATAGEDSLTKMGIGIVHNLGAGVSFRGTFANVKWEDESTNDADNNDGWMAIAGVRVGF